MSDVAASAYANYPPMLRQYLEIKDQHQSELLFFRLGDFYELFFEDAVRGADLLDLTLTQRGKVDDEPVPMAGVPHHSATGYFRRALDAGYTLVIAEQEKAIPGKKLLERHVERILTPGTLVEEELLDEKRKHCLAAVFRTSHTRKNHPIGVAVLDVSASRGYLCEVGSAELLCQLLESWQVVECLVADDESQEFTDQLASQSGFTLTTCIPREFSASNGAQWLRDSNHHGERSKGVKCALGALSSHIKRAFGQDMRGMCRFETLHQEHYISIDPSSAANLDLVGDSSLLDLLDICVTPMGSRALAHWITHPLRVHDAIASRADFIRSAMASNIRHIHQSMRGISDVERAITRLGTRNQYRALASIASSLAAAEKFVESVGEIEHPFTRDFIAVATKLAPLTAKMQRAIFAGEGDMLIAEGYDEELDTLRNSGKNFDADVEHLRAKVADELDNPHVKIGYHRVHGYFVEVRRHHSTDIPPRFRRTQTLKHSERFTFAELEALQTRVTQSKVLITERESRLVTSLADEALAQSGDLALLSDSAGTIDALLAMAITSHKLQWQPAQLCDEAVIDIEGAWHPLVIANSSEPFVPNSFRADSDARLLIVTGPNMGGKSTFMRQTALVVVLAHMGCPVPAAKATIGPVDRIFCRLGARDDIARGQSTFMVEMSEMATILRQATASSFVIVDEIGRGTSTKEGAAIAQSVAEELVENIGSVTLFATHFAELERLINHRHVRAVHVEALVDKDEHNDDRVHFTHRIKAGFVARSHAYEVAKLAGVPRRVIQRARGKAPGYDQPMLVGQAAPVIRDEIDDLGLEGVPDGEYEREVHPALEQLAALDIDALSPREALEILYELREQLEKGDEAD